MNNTHIANNDQNTKDTLMSKKTYYIETSLC